MLVKDYGKYRQKKQVRKLVPNKKNSRKKHYYLRELFENCALPETERKWEVYTNEAIFTNTNIETMTSFNI